jgi:hypothetical protein
VRPETKTLANAPSTYLHRFTFDTISHSKRILEFVIAEVGAERVMIGSDYCFRHGHNPAGAGGGRTQPERVAALDGAGWHGGAHTEAMTAAAEVTIVYSGV